MVYLILNLILRFNSKTKRKKTIHKIYLQVNDSSKKYTSINKYIIYVK